MIKGIVLKLHEKWAKDKVIFFSNNINLPENASLLDLGGNDGAYMKRFSSFLSHTYKIIVADLDKDALVRAQKNGFDVRFIDGSSDRFPFQDNEFDCIFCNSVIEHITLPKSETWNYNNDFKKRSLAIQSNFCKEIMRCSKSYYVQTPHRNFPIESHTWFPFVGIVPRNLQISIIKLLNRFWIKGTIPDWNLLNEKQMRLLFPDAEIHVVKKLGFKKEIIAIKKFSENK